MNLNRKTKSPSKLRKTDKVTIKPKRSNIDIENSKSENLFVDSKLPKLVLDSIVYSNVNRKEFDKIKTCEVTKISNTSSSNTTEDEKMGTLDNRTYCKSCFKSNDQCPGHYGIIN